MEFYAVARFEVPIAPTGKPGIIFCGIAWLACAAGARRVAASLHVTAAAGGGLG